LRKADVQGIDQTIARALSENLAQQPDRERRDVMDVFGWVTFEMPAKNGSPPAKLPQQKSVPSSKCEESGTKTADKNNVL
jgi:hypothetical protein